MASITEKGRIQLTKIEEDILFSDCNGLCSLCGKSLVFLKGGKYRRGFQAAHIYPHSPTKQQIDALQDVPKPRDIESIDNIVLLCERSHNIQDCYTSRQDYLKLYNIKQEQLKNRQAKESIEWINIEPEIDKVLEGLKSVNPDELNALKMIPVEVKQKVTDYPLQSKITGFVVLYFNYIKSKLQSIDKSHTRHAKAIAQEIALCFTRIQCSDFLIDQNTVFNKIVDWMVSKTHGNRTACEIVVSYYVQDCEVFDAPSK